jgi:hypothetical protein
MDLDLLSILLLATPICFFEFLNLRAINKLSVLTTHSGMTILKQIRMRLLRRGTLPKAVHALSE